MKKNCELFYTITVQYKDGDIYARHGIFYREEESVHEIYEYLIRSLRSELVNLKNTSEDEVRYSYTVLNYFICENN